MTSPHDKDREALYRAAAVWVARMRGESADRSRAEFQAWRNEDPRHDQIYRSVEALLASPATPPRGSIHFLSNARVWKVAAAAIVGMTFAILVAYQKTTVPAIDSHRIQGANAVVRLAAPIGLIRTFALDDGTRVILDSGSVMLVSYTVDERRFRLVSGRARISPQPGRRSYLVITGSRSIRIRDTPVDVTAAGAATKHLDGDVAPPPSAKKAARSAVQSLEHLSRTPFWIDTGILLKDEDWTSGSSRYDHTPLPTVLMALNRYSVTPIRLGTPELRRLVVSGRLHIAQPDRALSDLARAFRLRVEHRPGVILLQPTR